VETKVMRPLRFMAVTISAVEPPPIMVVALMLGAECAEDIDRLREDPAVEKILGSPVVDRGRSGVILTAAGEEAFARAQSILAQAEDLVQAARGAGQPLTGRFRLGVIPTIAPFLLPKALPVLRARFWAIIFQTRSASSGRCFLAQSQR